ncbi:hypothetical protein SAMN05878482_104488 [Peribacillus simplex]|uniref:Uncharacterized protein n=1 Tax=Peribacillus simplex TaxID=1478 RepID=A0A9X8WLE2_9BACI|nr:hypothetical protein SAMN05878482_104488 [Peribacillus simplex]
MGSTQIFTIVSLLKMQLDNKKEAQFPIGIEPLFINFIHKHSMEAHQLSIHESVITYKLYQYPLLFPFLTNSQSTSIFFLTL